MANHPLSTDVLTEIARLGGTIPDDFTPRDDIVVPTPAGERELPASVQAILAIEWPAGQVLLFKEKSGSGGRSTLHWELSFPAPAPMEPGFVATGFGQTWFTVGRDRRDHLFAVDLDGNGQADDPAVYQFDDRGRWFPARPLSMMLARVSAQRPPAKKNALARAAARGDVGTARALITGGASLGPVNATGVTPLHMAALTSRSPEMVRLLADAGADVNAAITAAKPPTLYSIIDSGRLLRRELGPGETPLGAALQGRGPTLEGLPITATVVEELLRAGADPNLPDGEGRTPLLRACLAYGKGVLKVVRMLLAAGADVDPPTGTVSPLYVAVADPEVMAVLLEAGADPCQATKSTFREASGLTPLHEAARLERRGAMRVLTAAAGDVDVRTPEGVTPLHIAATGSDSEPMWFLLEAGADPNAAMNDEAPFAAWYGPDVRTPLDIARKRGRVKAVALMEKYA